MILQRALWHLLLFHLSYQSKRLIQSSFGVLEVYVGEGAACLTTDGSCLDAVAYYTSLGSVSMSGSLLSNLFIGTRNQIQFLATQEQAKKRQGTHPHQMKNSRDIPSIPSRIPARLLLIHIQQLLHPRQSILR